MACRQKVAARNPVIERLPTGWISQLCNRFGYGSALIIHGKRFFILLLCIHVSLLLESAPIQLSVCTPVFWPGQRFACSVVPCDSHK